ncbi:MAG: CDP-alcohol phosphatidyltransferase family protein [Solirubrobacteraceae bacterium]
MERRVLPWLAKRLPAWMLPDHLTALGIAAAGAIGVAYGLSNGGSAWLWIASGLLIIHWFADSLDGTLARVRKIERPRYGYYLDHLTDAVSTAAIGIGLGLSPHMLLSTGLIIVIAYLVMSINVYLEAFALGRFRLGYGRLGPTEARIALVALNIALAVGMGPRFELWGIGLGALDVVGLAAASLMLVLLVVRAIGNLRELAAAEPSAGKRGDGSSGGAAPTTA